MIGASLVAAIGGGTAVAIDRGGGQPDQTDSVAPLSAADRTALAADRRLIASLPAALAEVPQAAADAAGTDVSTAQSDLADVAGLNQLEAAVEGGSSAVTLLLASYQTILAGKAVDDEPSVPQALATLQAVEGDIVPAVRVVALRHGRHLRAAAALTAVERDPKAAALGRVLADWSQIYGAFLLMEQDALS